MKHDARLASSVCFATGVVLCLTILFYTSTHAISPAHATSETITGGVVSSPSSGPVGAIIAISGSGLSDPNGEQVSFGYMIASYCSIVPDSQTGTLHGGSFSGWLRWPNGTPLGTYTVCATFGVTTAQASSYTVLSESAPQVSISPSILTAGIQATITGSNYYPAGSTVQLSWEAVNGSVNFGISSASSNSNGSILRTFVVPTTSIASGSYKIVAVVGGGQPPTLSSSATFTYNAPIPTPSPTPSLGPDPTPTQPLSPTVTATVVGSPIVTPTIGSTPSTGSLNTNTGQTSTSHTTTATHQPISILLIVGGAGFLALLTVILIIVLLTRRKKAHSKKMMGEVGSPTNGLLTWQNRQIDNAVPGNMSFPMSNISNTSMSPWPVIPANDGSINPPPLGMQSTPPSPQQLQVSPYAHLLHQPNGGSTGLVNDHASFDLYDPNFEAIKRQAQMGLFAIPGQRRNEEPTS